MDLGAGTALRLEVEQEQVDLEVHASFGDQAYVIDTPVSRWAPERLCIVASEPTRLMVDVTPYRGSGEYTLQVLELAGATPEDQVCFEGLMEFLAAISSNLDPEERALRFEKAAMQLESGDSFQAGLAWRQASVSWLDAASSTRAVESLQRALSQARRAESGYLEGSVLNRLARAYLRLGDFERAESTLLRSEAHSRDTGDRRGLAEALTNQGQLSPRIGSPHLALDQLRRASEIWSSLGQTGQQAQALIYRATALGYLGRYAEAEDDLETALALARESNDQDREAHALFALGWNHYLDGRPGDGLQPLFQARDMYRLRKQRSAEASSLGRIGTLQARSGDPSGAAESYRKSLELLGAGSDPAEAAVASANLGCLLADTGPHPEASDYLNAARQHIEQMDDPATRAHFAYCNAKLARLGGDLDSAIQHSLESLNHLDELRDRARLSGQRFLPIWIWQDYARLGVELHSERFEESRDSEDLASAFEIADQARAWSLFEQVVARRGAAVRSDAYPRLVQRTGTREAELQHRLNLLAATQRSLSANEHQERLKELEAESRRLALELEGLRAAERASERRAGHLGSPRAVTAKDIQSYLPPNTRLLMYVLAEPRSRLLLVSSDAIKVEYLAGREVIESHAISFYRALESSDRDDLQWRLIAEQFGRLLLPPGSLDSQDRHIVVLADGRLHYVPFAALASPRRDYRVGYEGDVLIDDLAITYAPSASVLLALDGRERERRVPPPKTVAVWADPVFLADDERFRPHVVDPVGGGSVAVAAGPTSRGNASRGPTGRGLPGLELRTLEGPLPRLPHSAREAQAILDLAGEPSSSWLGFQATRESVLETPLSQFRYLHFATHAWIDESVPELSGLAFSRLAQDGDAVEGDLRLHEIHDLHLAAELAFLSGCQTALGKHVQGNGLLGLNHGFFDAGASRVLVTLWAVDDEAASLLAPVFYEHLLAGESPAEALRQAQLWLRKQPRWQAPRHWAEFVLHGAL